MGGNGSKWVETGLRLVETDGMDREWNGNGSDLFNIMLFQINYDNLKFGELKYCELSLGKLIVI